MTNVRAFFGLCSYYRRSIADFATIAAPLYELQRKNVRFHWSERQKETFDQLKQKLISAPVLGMPRDDCTYYVDTDAFEVKLRAVIFQNQVVVAYALKALGKAERRDAP